jgi:hypothetical protein
VRDGLQPSVGDRLAAIDRHPVGPVLDPLKSALYRLKLLLEPVDHRLVALLLEQLGSRVRGMLVDGRELAVIACLRPQIIKFALDALLLGLQEFSCLARVQGGGKLAVRLDPLASTK